MTATTATATTHTLEVPGATLTYDVSRDAASGKPPLMLVGSPMAAAGFASLKGHFPDRTIITYDPRGSERSVKADPASPSTPDEHADDLHRVIAAVGGPVDLFGSSGGALNCLVLVSKHPEDVRTLVAHEPPVASALPDRDAAIAAALAVQRTYMAGGFGRGMGHFIAMVGHQGEFPADWADRPAPDPAMFGLPAEDDGDRSDPLLAGNMGTGPMYVLDYEALRAASTRIVLAAGVESEGILPYRGAFSVADRLGLDVVIFPSNHGGFLGGEYGQMGQPEAFAAKLRAVLAAG